jgi:hypothetical protein
MRLGELRVMSLATQRLLASCVAVTVEQRLNCFAQAVAVLDEPIATEAPVTDPSRSALIETSDRRMSEMGPTTVVPPSKAE